MQREPDPQDLADEQARLEEAWDDANRMRRRAGLTAESDQYRARLVEMARVGSAYYSQLLLDGIPEATAGRMLEDWNRAFWMGAVDYGRSHGLVLEGSEWAHPPQLELGDSADES